MVDTATHQHQSPCAWMKAILALSAIVIAVDVTNSTLIRTQLAEQRIETAALVTAINTRVDKIDMESRSNLVALSRMDERLLAIQITLGRIELELTEARKALVAKENAKP
jgi:hypothetical protein